MPSKLHCHFDELNKASLNKVRKVFKIKGVSNLKRGDLAQFLNDHFACLIIQRCYRIWKFSNRYCPFTLEKPTVPYFSKGGQYYNLEPLIGYLSCNSNRTCPITRSPFTKDNIKQINRIAKRHKLNKVTRPKVPNPIIENSGFLLDSILGEIVLHIEDDGITAVRFRSIIDRRIIPGIVPIFCALRRHCVTSADSFVYQCSQNMIVLNSSFIGDDQKLDKTNMTIVLIEGLNQYADIYEAPVVRHIPSPAVRRRPPPPLPLQTRRPYSIIDDE